jgi:ABC-type transport system involved in cytochrome c biogenesis permease subunit
MNILPLIAFALIALAAVLESIFAFKKGSRGDPASPWLLLTAASLLIAFFIARSVVIDFFALTGTYESLVFYSAFVALFCGVYGLQKRIPVLPFVRFGTTIFALGLLAVANSPLAPKDALFPIPALKSGWLALHVSLAFVGEAFFVVSFVSALAFLSSKDESRKKEYDRVTYTAVALGYPVFTAGALIFGAIWAERAWGAWWSWDPKETWALVTWLVYTLYLHIRFIKKRSDRLPALVSVIGFLCTLFTFFGVNFLLSGLHSYG